MSTIKAIKTVKDADSFNLTLADLTGTRVGEFYATSQRNVPCSNGLKWWFQLYPARVVKEEQHFVGVFLNVNKAVSAKFCFKVDGSNIKISGKYVFPEPTGSGFPTFVSYRNLQHLLVNGQVSILCEVEFDIPLRFAFLPPRIMRHSDRIPTDFQIIVGRKRLNVHKGFLSVISPVFHAMLPHDTAVSKRGNVKITDIDFDVVKAAIDYCYGRQPENPSVETIVGILCFADKYDIQAVIDDLGKIPVWNLSAETFGTIVHYAYYCSKTGLFDQCCNFFKQRQDEIREKETFLKLDPTLVAHLLKQAYNLKTQFDVLRHAQLNEMLFILEPLEHPIIESLSLDNFCDVVSYAWDCTRNHLQNTCAKFYNDNQAEIRKMKLFYDLAPSTMHRVLKMGFDIL